MTANNNNKLRLINPDPIRTTNPHTTSSSTNKKLCGNGPNSSYRHIHHQRGTIGTFHIRLLEANNLSRKHWSVLSLGHLKHLGLSNSHGEVSSFGTLRLGFWQDDENGGGSNSDDQEENVMNNQRAGDGLKKSNDEDDCNNSVSSSSISSGSAYHEQQIQQQFTEEGKSPLTPLLFDQGSIKSVSSSSANGLSPFLQSYPTRQQTKASLLSTPPRSSLMQTEDNDKPQQLPIPSPLSTTKRSTNNNSGASTSISSSSPSFGPSPPHHYAKEEYKSTTVHSDNNPIWHGGSSNNTNSNNMESSDGSNTFNIPLQKDDLLPTIHNDGGKIKLEIRIDEELSNTEKLSGGALSTAVSAASVATSVVGIGKQTKDVSTKGMELLGLSTDRLIGKGVVDLMPLLLGYWDESNDTSSDIGSKEEELQDSSLLNEYGQMSQSAYRMRRRIGQLELLDVWVPLYHPSVTTQKANKEDDQDNRATIETSGKVHLLISYTPNGMVPKPDDIVAFESFARRPISSNTSSSVVNVGPVITPIIPPLSPLLVIETRGQYLLLEYSTSRTITSVDRNGNVKSSRYERSHRTRVHRNAVFVIERHTLLDAAGNIARLPGDIVLSTPIGQEIVQASAPLVAGALELVGPAVLGGKLMMAAGWTGVRMSLAGARAATEAVVVASQEKALERRDGGQSDRSGDAGAYGYIG